MGEDNKLDEKLEEQEAIESEARDDARDEKYDDNEIKDMLGNILEKLDALADGMKAMFVSSPAPAEDESEEDEESYSLEDLEL